MAVMTITEYEYLATDRSSRPVQALQEPSIATQQITDPASSASVTLSAKTKFVRVHVTAKMHFKTGPGTLTAATTDTPIGATGASGMEIFGVVGGHTLAAINGA